ncbi:MAG: phosphodiester glycosidase family protein [Flexilinea flocculi]|nr:phosphodiester glycosidase family protein [Flexilinea flocculi]
MNEQNPRKQYKIKRISFTNILLIDLFFIGFFLCIFALFHHVIPIRYKIIDSEPSFTSKVNGDLGDKFASFFSNGKTYQTKDLYISEKLRVQLTIVQQDGITYYLEEFFLRDIHNLRSAFAENTYGKSVRDQTINIAKSHHAIAAINGDNYGLGKNRSAVIRNGVLFRDSADGDVLVLFTDGTMEIVSEDQFDGERLIKNGAYQAWNFGPSLLNEGKAMESFNTRINQKNPRTAIGYFEPGHYCFIVVDGRQAGYSTGMTMTELSKLFESLGCKLAYNLDGGKTSVMTFLDKIVNKPFAGGRETTDIIYISE